MILHFIRLIYQYSKAISGMVQVMVDWIPRYSNAVLGLGLTV